MNIRDRQAVNEVSKLTTILAHQLKPAGKKGWHDTNGKTAPSSAIGKSTRQYPTSVRSTNRSPLHREFWHGALH